MAPSAFQKSFPPPFPWLPLAAPGIALPQGPTIFLLFLCQGQCGREVLAVSRGTTRSDLDPKGQRCPSPCSLRHPCLLTAGWLWAKLEVKGAGANRDRGTLAWSSEWKRRRVLRSLEESPLLRFPDPEKIPKGSPWAGGLYLTPQ